MSGVDPSIDQKMATDRNGSGTVCRFTAMNDCSAATADIASDVTCLSDRPITRPCAIRPIAVIGVANSVTLALLTRWTTASEKLERKRSEPSVTGIVMVSLVPILLDGESRDQRLLAVLKSDVAISGTSRSAPLAVRARAPAGALSSRMPAQTPPARPLLAPAHPVARTKRRSRP